jgi:hypothetical protein
MTELDTFIFRCTKARIRILCAEQVNLHAHASLGHANRFLVSTQQGGERCEKQGRKRREGGKRGEGDKRKRRREMYERKGRGRRQAI